MSNFDGRGRGRGRGGPRGDRGHSRGRGSSLASRGSSPGSGSSRGSSPTMGRGRGRGASISVFNPGPAQIDSRLGDKDMDTLISALKKLSTSDRIVRPGFGRKGTNVTLRANFFEMSYPKNIILYDHPLVIDPEVKPIEKRLRTRLFELFEQNSALRPYLHGIAHDKMQRLIAVRPLPDDLSVTVDYFESGQKGPRQDGKKYTIKIQKPRELKSSELDRHLQGQDAVYDPLPIISAFNLIMTTHATRNGVSFGKNRYFFPPSSLNPSEEPFYLSQGLEAWKGFFTSVRPTYKSLMMNVNVCMGAFIIPNKQLSEIILQCGESSASFLRRARVTLNHTGYRKRATIKEFGSKTARETVFQCDKYGKISVEQYFKKQYNINLKHAHDLPVINIGSKTKDVLIPAELCEIEPGQPYGGTLSDKETAEMIKFACNPPNYNAETIVGQGLQMLGLANRAQPIAGFGVDISQNMAVVAARVLNAPRVSYSVGQAKITNGSWNLMNIKFSKSVQNIRPAILVLGDNGPRDFRNGNEVQETYEGFRSLCNQCGMNLGTPVGGPLLVRLPRPNLRSDPYRLAAIGEIEKTIKSLPGRPDLILVFLSSTDRSIYYGLKKLCDVKLGVATVCMQMSKVRNDRGQLQYFANVAMKVNAKLGGVNHVIPADSHRWLKDAMLVGMDVTHPGNGPSIAAVVASYDGSFNQYPASLRLQGRRVEMITDVKDMMKERLTEYQNRNKKLPERIIIFRDGVSEGQFDIVLKDEVREIKAAFRAFKSYNPKLTVVICGKRHHTRFFPTSEADADRTSNTKAGTVVDKGVTSVYDFDFYLQAHAGLQGTVRATHYSVIYDENKLSADEIQQGVNDISYLWARATKSVSYAPPAYWADRACERGRAWLHGAYPPPGKMTEEQIDSHLRNVWGNGINENLKSTMFYL